MGFRFALASIGAATVHVAELLRRVLVSVSELLRWGLPELAEIVRLAVGRVRASTHCFVKHGGGPAERVLDHHVVLYCPMCGRVFWRSRDPA